MEYRMGNEMNLLESQLSDIASEIPGATAILNRYDLSFCCGGTTLLSQAIADQGADQEEILIALSRLVEQQKPQKNWKEASTEELITHLLQRYHSVHREQLAELHRLASRVESVHFNSPDCPKGLADLITEMSRELEQHMEKEESVLFPMMIHNQNAPIAGPVSVLMHEHEDHLSGLNRIDVLTNNIIAPEGACNTWRALYLGLKTFKNDLVDHIHLENDILFMRDSAATVNKERAQAVQVDPKQAEHGVDFCCGSCGG